MTISRKILIVVLILFVFGLVCKVIVDVNGLDENYQTESETQSQSSEDIDLDFYI